MMVRAWLGMGMIVVGALGVGCGGVDDGVFGGASSGSGSGSGAGGTTAATTGAGGASSSAASGSGGATTSTTSAGSGGSGGSCTELAWFCDDDLDTYGDKSNFVAACEAPAGSDACAAWVSSNDDCGPADAAAFPGQEEYFEAPVAPPTSGNLAFDYSCNNVEERNPEQLFKGIGMPVCGFGDCTPGNQVEGFGANAPCGEKEQYFRCVFEGISCASVMVEAPVILRCR